LQKLTKKKKTLGSETLLAAQHCTADVIYWTCSRVIYSEMFFAWALLKF